MGYEKRSNLVWQLADYRKLTVGVFATSTAFLFIFLLLAGALN